MAFGQNHSLESPAEWPWNTCCGAFYEQNHSATVSSHVALLLFFKNYNSQHSGKLPGPWVGKAYRLISGFVQGRWDITWDSDPPEIRGDWRCAPKTAALVAGKLVLVLDRRTQFLATGYLGVLMVQWLLLLP